VRVTKSTDQMLTSRGVPHACHDVGTTTVIGSHSKTSQTASDRVQGRGGLDTGCYAAKSLSYL